jgi:hypothetical protein
MDAQPDCPKTKSPDSTDRDSEVETSRQNQKLLAPPRSSLSLAARHASLSIRGRFGLSE